MMIKKKKNMNELITETAKVVSVNISRTKGVVKTPIGEGFFEEGLGLVGDAHSGNWHRMVSLLAMESYDKLRAKGAGDLPIGSFAENITCRGIILHELPLGTKFSIGDCLLEVTQIGKECHRGCQIKQLVGDCVMPREGIFCKVLASGAVKAGDGIKIR